MEILNHHISCNCYYQLFPQGSFIKNAVSIPSHTRLQKKKTTKEFWSTCCFRPFLDLFFGGWDSGMEIQGLHLSNIPQCMPLEKTPHNRWKWGLGKLQVAFCTTIELTHILNRLESSWEWIYFWNHLMRYDFNSSNTVFGFDPSLSHWRCLLILIENDPCFPCFCKFAFDQWVLLLQDFWKSLSHNGWPEKVVDKKQQQRNSASSNCCACLLRECILPVGKYEKVACLFPSNDCMSHLQNPIKTTATCPWFSDSLTTCQNVGAKNASYKNQKERIHWISMCHLFKGVARKLSKPLKFWWF